jgi:ribosomal protein S18 acetylase RimI-like enzyme
MELQIIRTIHPPDVYVTQLSALYQDEGYEISVERLRDRVEALHRDDRLLLAVDGDHLIGYAHLRTSKDLIHEETSEVICIIVRAGYRRQGIGRRLLRTAESYAEQSGKSRLIMKTNVLQSQAQAFFSSMGYEQVGTSVEYIRDLSGQRDSNAPTLPLPNPTPDDS